MGPKLIFRLLIALCLGAIITPADSLELKNGSLIKGRFVGGTEAEIRFQAGSSVQKYAVADIVSLKFESDTRVSETPSTRDQEIEALASVTVPSGTRLSVRTIDAIDSAKNHVGDRFEASLEEPVTVDGRVVVPKGASVYGCLEDAKTSGTFTGRSELRLALTEIVVNGQTVPLVSGEYELNGKSRGASTAKRTIGGRPSEQSLEPWPAEVRVLPLEPEQAVLLGQGQKSSPKVTRSKYRARPRSISHWSRTCLCRFTKTECVSTPRQVRRSNGSFPDVSESVHCN